MAFRLLGTKPLSEPMLTYNQLGPKGLKFSEILIEIQKVSFKNMFENVVWKMAPFCLGLSVLNITVSTKINGWNHRNTFPKVQTPAGAWWSLWKKGLMIEAIHVLCIPGPMLNWASSKGFSCLANGLKKSILQPQYPWFTETESIILTHDVYFLRLNPNDNFQWFSSRVNSVS